MREVVSIVDDVHRWHDQGGWSQARFQRGIQKETKDHLKHAGEELFKLYERGAVKRLIVGTPDEMRGEVESTLHSYLRERIAGWLEIDVKARPADVAHEAAAIIEEDERKRERVWLERLKSELGRNSRGAAGLADTLEALNERRVEALLVQDGFRTDGLREPGGGLPLDRARLLAGRRRAATARRRDRAGAGERARAVGRGGGGPPPP